MSPNFTKASHVDFVQNVNTLNWIEKYVVYLRQLYINGSNTVADPGRTKRSLPLLTKSKNTAAERRRRFHVFLLCSATKIRYFTEHNRIYFKHFAMLLCNASVVKEQ